MDNGINKHIIEEGSFRAIKDTGTFGGCNMWHFQGKDTNGYFRDIQWMSIDNIQCFFNKILPKYKKISTSKFERIF